MNRTAPRLDPAGSPPPTRLELEVRRIIGPAMGSRFYPERWEPRVKTWHWVVIALLAPALLWLAILPWAGEGDPMLRTLLTWGACYFACAALFARSTTASLYATIAKDILPYASQGYADAVARDLRRRYPNIRRIALPLVLAGVFLAAAWYALQLDHGVIDPLVDRRATPELLLWAFCYFILFLTATVGVGAGRFYVSFANCLDLERERFNVLGAADSPLVRGLSRLGTQVLIFWA